MFIQIYDKPPKIKSFAKKKYFIINFVHLIHKACQILSTFTKWRQSSSSVSQSVPSSSSHSLLTCPLSSLSFHNKPSSVPFTALNIQHVLKPFTITSGEMRSHANMTQSDRIHLIFWFRNLREPMIHNFLHRWS